MYECGVGRKKELVHSAKPFQRSKTHLTKRLFLPQERENLARRQMLEEERRRREEAEKRLQDETFHRLQLVEKEVKMRSKNLTQVSKIKYVCTYVEERRTPVS